ncbi:MAG: hypothetical protein PHQ40_17530 [Anaerolineaceae bacterium]|nr:hypothetical protein [Anaerolineaceae bacterium]
MDRKANAMQQPNDYYLYDLILDYQRDALAAAKQRRMVHEAEQSRAAAIRQRIPFSARLGLRMVSWGLRLQARAGIYPLPHNHRSPCTD